ncbi:unnamed protein product [Trichobilharzia regenti]|nr:unnamed protein product [Trichobilharzia regenti]
MKGCYYQKCLDPDCRLVDFRSPSMPIPLEFLSNPTTSNETNQSTDYGNAVCEDEYFDAAITSEDLMLGSLLDSLQK